MSSESENRHDRRNLFLLLLALFVLDTMITVWAIAHGSAEANPLYWAFHDVHLGWQGIADAVAVRVTLGVAVFYLLDRRATTRLLRMVVNGYATVIGTMCALHILALVPKEELEFVGLVLKLIGSAYLIALGVVLLLLVAHFLTASRLMFFSRSHRR